MGARAEPSFRADGDDELARAREAVGLLLEFAERISNLGPRGGASDPGRSHGRRG